MEKKKLYVSLGFIKNKTMTNLVYRKLVEEIKEINVDIANNLIALSLVSTAMDVYDDLLAGKTNPDNKRSEIESIVKALQFKLSECLVYSRDLVGVTIDRLLDNQFPKPLNKMTSVSSEMIVELQKTPFSADEVSRIDNYSYTSGKIFNLIKQFLDINTDELVFKSETYSLVGVNDDDFKSV